MLILHVDGLYYLRSRVNAGFFFTNKAHAEWEKELAQSQWLTEQEVQRS